MPASFDDACALIDSALHGRREILADVAQSSDSRKSLLRLRERMRTHAWKAGPRLIDLHHIVTTCDTLTRKDGFHAIHDWDGVAEKVNADIIPLDVLDYLLDRRGEGPASRTVLAILVDYYFLYLLALLSLRIWDEGGADDHLDRLDQLLRELQGPNGSGQLFADDAATLMLIATSHYELDDRAYDALLDRVRTLNHSHRLELALVHAAGMGCHLRFGFEATYGRDMVAMREDNGTDYPWLCFSFATLIGEYARMRREGAGGIERETIVEALMNGLSTDTNAFVGEHLPACLTDHERERAGFSGLFAQYKQDLLEEGERYRPSEERYSPLSFFFNFSYNVLKGTVVDALLRGEPWRLSLNDLLTGISRGESDEAAKLALAKTLMEYARSNPHTIRGRLMPVIVYDPQAGRQAFGLTMRKINIGT